MRQKKGKIHYAWLVLIGCCALVAGSVGFFINSSGVFFLAISQDLGYGMGQLSFFYTVQLLAMMVALPAAGRLLTKYDTRLLLTVNFSICLMAAAAMSRYTLVWQWYLSGAVIGFCGAFLYTLPVSLILGNWFSQKTSLAIGIAMAFTGVGSALMNPFASWLIATIGWRTAYLVVAGLGGILVLPFTVFVLALKPQVKGWKPYGCELVSEEDGCRDVGFAGVPVKKAMHSLTFVFVLLGCGLLYFISGYSQHFPAYADSVGLSAAVGATMVSFAMIGNIVGKLALGALNDWLGTRKVTLIAMMLVALSFLLLLLNQGNRLFVFGGAFLFGICIAMASLGGPFLTRSLFGEKDYGAILANLSAGQCFIGALGMPTIGLLYDYTGSYQSAFSMGLWISVIILLLIFLAYRASRSFAELEEITEENKRGTAC